VAELKLIAESKHIPFSVTHVGGMFGVCFTSKSKIENYTDVANSNISLFNEFFHGMLHEGIYLAPSAFEAGFVSSAHSLEEIQLTLNAADKVFDSIESLSS